MKTLTKQQGEFLKHGFRQMLRARLLDDKSILLYKQNKCHFQISCAGHEAVQVAAAAVFRPGVDWFYPYYRDMAFCLGLGMTDDEFILNMVNKPADPSSHGRAMPMHYGHKKLNIVQQSSPVGSQFPQAVGCALASKLKKSSEVVYVSAGEGACAQGDFHEAMNWASRDKLPLVVLIENNDYAISVHVSEQLASPHASDLAKNYPDFEVHLIDGTDLLLSHETFKSAYARAQSGKGPVFIEAKVPRLQSHSISDNHLKYRAAPDLENEKKKCPIERVRQQLLELKIADIKELSEIEETIRQEIEQASLRVEAAADWDPADALTHSFRNSEPGRGIVESEPSGPESFLVDALNHTLAEELARDERVVIFGEDVAHGKGGVFGVTAGLTAQFGAARVFNSQLAESSIVGTAIGLAGRGYKPVIEIQFGDYVWPAMNQIRNELAMLNYRSAGDFSAPVVVRIPVGGYIHGGAYHSQNVEATFSHFPGLYIVYPSNASDAKGLLKSSIRGDDPVLYLEHKGLYRQVFAKSAEGGPDHLVPLGKARVVDQGEDLTIVTWGALVQRSREVRNQLAERGLSVEVIDIRTIVPLDFETIQESIKKTHRILIAHEDMVFMGFGAEIAAQISETCFADLDAPVMRVGMKYAACVPHAPILEHAILPHTADILEKAFELIKF